MQYPGHGPSFREFLFPYLWCRSLCPEVPPAAAAPPPSPLLSISAPKACLFCSDASHFIRDCPVKLQYIESGKCLVGSDGRIRMPNGRLAPRSEGLVDLKSRIDLHCRSLVVDGKVNGYSGAMSLLYSLGYAISDPPADSSSCSMPPCRSKSKF